MPKSLSPASPKSGRNKRKHVTYRCTQRESKGAAVCGNKEIRREYIEAFVMREIEKIIFSDGRVGELVESYKAYRGRLGGEGEAAGERVSIFPALDRIGGGSDEAVTREITKYAASLAADFNEKMPSRSIPVPNPTEKLAVVGRRTLYRCYSHGE